MGRSRQALRIRRRWRPVPEALFDGKPVHSEFAPLPSTSPQMPHVNRNGCLVERAIVGIMEKKKKN